MKIAVASRNPVKLEASRVAFERVFADSDLTVVAVDTTSGVPDQPMSDEQYLAGSRAE